MNTKNLNEYEQDKYEIVFAFFGETQNKLAKNSEHGDATRINSYNQADMIQDKDMQPVIDSKSENYEVVITIGKNGKPKAYRKLRDGRVIEIKDVDRIIGLRKMKQKEKNKEEGLSH